MFEYQSGDMFESNAECLVNTVNCEGYMGKGIAYQFKQKYPENYRSYVDACKSGELHIGTIHCFKENGTWIVNFPTKDKWREKSRMDYIEKGLAALSDFLEREAPSSIAIPPLGCGNGGLLWDDVGPKVENALLEESQKINIMLYAPEPRIYNHRMTERAFDEKELALIRIKQELGDIDYYVLQSAAYLVGYRLGKPLFDDFQFGKKFGSEKLKQSARKLNSRKSNDLQGLYDSIYKTICSKRIDAKMKEIKPALSWACKIVKQVDDVNLLMNMVRALDELSKAKSISADLDMDSNMKESLERLFDLGVIQRDVLGEYVP